MVNSNVNRTLRYEQDLRQSLFRVLKERSPILPCLIHIGRKALEFYEGAIAIRSWLRRRQVPNKIWKISTHHSDEDFILSGRLEQQGITDSTTDNGIHYGVEVRGKVFDKLSPQWHDVRRIGARLSFHL